ncbi:hypothetical protein BGW39_006349 [Mortierella sp. 14UC]|nr:hypothetical protein BGW39_006349 [Mortierella sp. 14UC]
MTEATEDSEVCTKLRIGKGKATEGIDAAGQETERWDDAFEFDAHQSLDKIFELLHRHCPQSPLSDSSDQSDYFQARPPPPTTAETSSLSPASSASSSPRAITASVTAPSTIATSTGSFLGKYKSADSGGGDKDSPALPTKSMTTITQEMMLSNLPAYTGIITRINPIKRVKAWVDDLEDLEVPEEDLDFNHVRSILAKSASMPETLESVGWDTDSERSITASDRLGTTAEVEGQSVTQAPKSETPHVFRHQSAEGSSPPDLPEDGTDVQQPGARASGALGKPERIETLDDAFEIPDDFGSFRLRMSPRLLNRSRIQETASHRQQLSLLQWRDSGSDFDELDFGTPLDSHSLSSSLSISRESVVEDDDNLLDGIEFPDDMKDLRLVTHRQYKVEMEPSIFGKESRLYEDQDDFWDGLEVGGDDAFNHKGRNKNLVERPILTGRERSSSRVQREVVPLKDFVALPSRIPRLCRGPTDTSRPVTPASSLSRAHSAYFELPLRHTPSKSSLPRLKRNSISRKESTSVGLGFQVAGHAMSSNESSAFSPTSTPPTPSSSKRNSALLNRDDLPSFKTSSLAMRSVSFTEPEQPVDIATATPTTPPSTDTATILPKPPASRNTGRPPFSSLRTLVRRLDFARPRFSIRGQIPVFDASSSASPGPSAPQESQEADMKSPIEQASQTDDFNEDSLQQRSYRLGITLSRSSSFTDWGSIVTSTETTKESRSPSRIGALSLGEISEGGSTTSDLGELAATSPVAAGEKFSRRWFLKRSPKQSMLSDGSELDRIDNLPTFGSGDQLQQQQQHQLQKQQLLDGDHLQAMQMAAVVAAAQGRRQSLDRVSAWLRKPQSMVNLKESPRPEARRAESDVSTTKAQKTKSIRRSLFDIFVQSAAPAEEPKKAELAETERELSTKGQKLKKKKPFSGPTLIRDLSQTKVRKVSGMVFHPDSKMWNGNDHILNEFDDDNDIDYANTKQQQHIPTTTTVAVFDLPSPPTPYSPQFPPSSYSPIANAIIRPALISNMSQYSKQRTQVAGKMIFDPSRMCWIINPEYLTRKRQKKHGDQHHLHPRQVSLDDTWGDEPDVFAGMSDSDADYDENEVDEETDDAQEGTTPVALAAAIPAAVAGVAAVSGSANSSMERSKGRRLISRPSFRRISSQDYLADEERLQAWAEPTRLLPLDTAGGQGGADSRPNSMGVHSIVSKSSRRSLNMTGGCSNGLFAGGGYSSRGEFEVGVEFDITDEFLEQCMATESQHRKDAGKFFALPCTPTESSPSALRNRSPQRIPSKVLNKLMKSSTLNPHGSKDKDNKNRDNDSAKDNRKHDKEITCADLPPLPLANKKVILSPSAPLPLLSWPRRTKSKTVVLQAPILDCIGLPPPLETQMTTTPKPLAFQAEKKPHTSSPNKFKSLTLGRAGLFSSTPEPTAPPTPTLFSRVSTEGKGKETVAPLADSQSTRMLPRVRKSSRDMFFSQRLSSKKSHTTAVPDRGTLTFAATFAIARKGNSTYDRRRISAHTFHPLTGGGPILDGSGSGSSSTNPEERGFWKDKRFYALDIDSGIDSDGTAEDEDDCERGYRKMPTSRGRPPRRTRSQLIMEFAQHSGPGYRF